MQENIKLYNTLTRTVENFTPIHPGKVSIYSCGPTVYHYQHLGNMRAVVVADTVRRMFVYGKYDVNHVINITDVGHNVDDDENAEDKMEKGSKREGKTVWEIAEFYTEDYFDCLRLLNVPLHSYTFPRATDHIQDQIEMVEVLEKKGYTYLTSDGVYFDTSKFPHYPDLAKLDIEGLKSGARVEENKEKRNITDFALWKFSPKDEQRQMEWESPWGKGFPGWHIECSAMSKKILGSHLDIHMGGKEHIPVHHTNEIAQSECANGEKYVNYWMHYNFLNDPTGKMSKSKGDFLRLQSVVDEGVDPLAYRYYLLTTHYRKEIEFSFEALKAAASAYEKLVLFAGIHHGSTGEVNNHYTTLFDQALFDDVGTPSAIAVIWNMVKDPEVSDADTYVTLISFDEVLGLSLKNAIRHAVVIPEEVQKLLDERKSARDKKDWATSDRLRDEIRTHGFDVKDSEGSQELTPLTQ